MVALVTDAFRQVGPFVIPVVVFALGVVGYGVLLWYTRWRNDRDAAKD